MRLNHEGMGFVACRFLALVAQTCIVINLGSRRYQHRLQPQKHHRGELAKITWPSTTKRRIVLIPTNIHLEMEDSLPKYLHKTDKKSTEEGRFATLVYCTMPDWKSNPGPETVERSLNLAHHPQISGRGNIVRMDGRIAKSKRPNLKASLEKLQTGTLSTNSSEICFTAPTLNGPFHFGL